MNKISFLFLTYGLFAVLCQVSLFFAWIEFQSHLLSTDILAHRYAVFLEYPLMSILLLFGGVLLMEHTLR